MPIENILYLGLVLAAITEFAAVLIYAEWVWKRAPNAEAPTLVHSAERRELPPITQDIVADKAA